jgi:hypothetical protein
MSERTIWESTLRNLIWLVMEPPITTRAPLSRLTEAAKFETVIRAGLTSNPNKRVKTAQNNNGVGDQEDLPERSHANSLSNGKNERMDAETDRAIDALIQANAGTVFALLALNGVIGFLRQAYGSGSASSPKSN